MNETARNEMASEFREREQARINVEGDGCVTALDEVESYLDGYENGIVDVLKAGLVVPPGLTAFELREIATWLTIRDPIDAADAAILAEMQTELRAWADALSTQETG